ncbi:acyltransferase family protein [Bacillus vallismortis]|uniref:acyltransferase family protein n=1 Tax=Bacillus vallismortis TaxID=72361 RepID=UPI0020912A29|nr:acyltransferase family protein [Bacillus vallismortis]MCO4851172.1 acyltransferase family protein [Bacillus vallismortis]
MQKDIKLNNVKGLLIFFVVFGHLLIASKSGLENMVEIIYSFHMPAFIFLNGYFSKRPSMKKVINLIFLYVIFQTFYCAFRYYAGNFSVIQFTYGRPHTHLWYIVSLGSWYALAIVLKKINGRNVLKAVLLILLLVLSFYSRFYADEIVEFIRGYYSNMHTQTMSILRTFVFLPFFLAGFYCSRDLMNKIYSSLDKLKFKLFFTLAVSVVVFIILGKHHDKFDQLFFGFLGYQKFQIENHSYTGIVFFHYLLAVLGMFLLLNLVGAGKNKLTQWGENSLAIFLFHMIFVFPLFTYNSWLNEQNPDTRLMLCFTMALGITSLFGSRAFNRIVKYIIYPMKYLELFYARLINQKDKNDDYKKRHVV